MENLVVNLEKFQQQAAVIVELANTFVNKSDYYRTENIELNYAVLDFNDGKGPVLSTRVQIRNPADGIIDMLLDSMSSTEEALEAMIESVKKMISKKTVAFGQTDKVKETKFVN